MIFLAAMAILAACSGAMAQLRTNVGIQPVWGPTGYDFVENYYIPDINAYYNVPTHQYIYSEHDQWVKNENLPARYGNTDLSVYHKVVINDQEPWLQNDRYSQKYKRYKGKHDQHAIRDSHDQRYWENPQHPEHARWQGAPSNGAQHGQENEHPEERGRH